MLRKENETVNRRRESQGHGHEAGASAKPHRPRRRFIISPKAHLASQTRSEGGNGQPKAPGTSSPKAGNAAGRQPTPSGSPVAAADLTETIKTLLHLAHEHGHVTYDDINDVLPDGLSPG